jgi:hypothetical protein
LKKIEHVWYIKYYIVLLLGYCPCLLFLVGWFMVFYATFNNISVISWWSVLLVEETVIPGENHWPVASHWQTLSHNVVLPEWVSNSQH